MQKTELGSIFIDVEDTTPQKSVSQEAKSVLEDSKSLSSETESELEEPKSESEILESELERYKTKQNPLKNFNAWLLIKYCVQFFVVTVFAENIKDIADDSMLSIMIFLFALASYPILVFTKYQKFSLKIAEFEAKIAENQANEKVGEELVRQKTLDYKNAFLKVQDSNKTLVNEVKRLQDIENRFLRLEEELLQTKQERTAYLTGDREKQEKLENALQEFRSLEAEKNDLVNALDIEISERQRLFEQVQTLTEENKTLTQANKRLFEQNEILLESEKTLSEKVKVLSEKVGDDSLEVNRLKKENEDNLSLIDLLNSENKTLSTQNQKFEDLMKEFVSYQKTLVNGVVGLRVGGALDKDFVKTYLSILEKCKGGAR